MKRLISIAKETVNANMKSSRETYSTWRSSRRTAVDI